jgi:3'(2'),5'-bisphosphate nucleotidase
MTPRGAWREPIIALAREAGEAIMRVYAQDFAVETKDDDSPLTAADMAAHRIIVAGLAALTPDIPVLSEEAADIPWQTRRSWSRLWLVDPLDGTREFVKKNGEFTVNIALIEDGEPTLSVVHAPALDYLVHAERGVGAFLREAHGDVAIVSTRPAAAPLRVAASRTPWMRAPRACSSVSASTSASAWAPRSSSAASPKAASTSIRASDRPRNGTPPPASACSKPPAAPCSRPAARAWATTARSRSSTPTSSPSATRTCRGGSGWAGSPPASPERGVRRAEPPPFPPPDHRSQRRAARRNPAPSQPHPAANSA